MPLSWNEIRTRALAFSNEWQDEGSEQAESQSFWNDFFNIFGITRRRVASFEKLAKKIDGKDGFIDLLWKGVLLIEHKSRGKNLDRAYTQALDYFPGLKERELPRFILVSDFARFRLYDLDDDTTHEFALPDLHQNIHHFAFIAGYQTHKIKEQDPVNIQAAELMGKLHDRLRAIGYAGHDLEIYLVRLLFCLFAEDTGIFQRQQFHDYIEDRTAEDGADLASQLDTLFYVLNTATAERLDNRDESLNAFPFVNGKLFEERLRPASFDRAMRESLLQCCALDWSRISPAIFGSLFQSIMDKEARRNLGAHYTSETNILKLINPLFMDDLRAEFEKVKNNRNKLFEFHKKLSTLKFLDPACGCGNFLVVAYRELRLLELEVLRVSRKGMKTFDVHSMIALDVNQFYGIEIEEFPAQIAQVALWLVDHQMNLLVSQEFGLYFARIPLTSSASIVHGNALQMDWREVIAPERLSFIMGNPPFIGKKEQSKEQKAEVKQIFAGIKGNGVLDYVTCWYMKAAQYIAGTKIKVAFVSTKSIVQGEQVGVLWNEMHRLNYHIFFAHRPFKWTNEARGKAAVHCVIIGFAGQDISRKQLFDYETVTSDPSLIAVKRINAYLVDAAEAIVLGASIPICKQAPKINYGSMGIDSGHLILTEEEKTVLLLEEPEAENYIRPFIGAEEYIKGKKRYCLWLKDAPPQEIRKLKHIRGRIEKVKQFRLSSNRKETKALANTPMLFGEIRQPDDEYLIIPKVSSESRHYIPIGYCPKHYIANGSSLVIAKASKYDFGVVTSQMHMAWMRAVGGRLESRYQYSSSLVYNNFPWPKDPSEKQTADIGNKAQAVLDARAQFPDSTLADLYDPLSMPPTLQKAHQALDKTVDRAYRKTTFNNEAERVSFLFDLYQQYTAPLLPKKKPKRRK
ncbi:class I SAM-dependent DNA methyltransferase [Candidatus Spongiihabitans sp.]|uniref:class I SAM-dependent DNA methyltransferase n=1 Tax=Candidatus Spongiihabitans sp. TaxID=3101308 RepID=UPI003C7E8F81